MNFYCLALEMSAAVVLGAASASAQSAPISPGFESSLVGRPANWTGDLFKANYAFPASASDMSTQPWMKLDPRKREERDQYYAAVLAYGMTAFAGDIFDGCKSVKADWYHAPWMTLTFGNSPNDAANGTVGAGREPICGLTQERSAPARYLHSKQARDKVQSWAIGMFNQPGAYILGRIWRDQWTADLSEMNFPEGTFVVKFLFTEASEAEVPYLKGSPTWSANVYTKDGATTRETKPMRLLQIDFAIRDKRMDSQTGWVFGTFMYANTDGSPSADWKTNVVPVGVMWGNDHDTTSSALFKEQALNPVVTKMRDDRLLFDLAVRHDFGWQDRVNGPIDNPVSSCLSCHGTAQVHKRANIKQFITPSLKTPNDKNKMLWFRNTKAGNPFVFTQAELDLVDQRAPSQVRADWSVANMADFQSTDYSLQVRMGIETSRAYAIMQAATEVNQLKIQSPKAFDSKPTVLDKITAQYRRESRKIERAGNDAPLKGLAH